MSGVGDRESAFNPSYFGGLQSSQASGKKQALSSNPEFSKEFNTFAPPRTSPFSNQNEMLINQSDDNASIRFGPNDPERSRYANPVSSAHSSTDNKNFGVLPHGQGAI